MYIHKVLLFKKKKMCFLVDTICAKYYLDQDLSPIQSQQSESDIYAYNSVSVGVGGCVRACVRVCACVCVCVCVPVSFPPGVTAGHRNSLLSTVPDFRLFDRGPVRVPTSSHDSN